MITVEDRTDPSVMSLIAQYMAQEDLVVVIATLTQDVAGATLMTADPISAIRVCLTHPEYLAVIGERQICGSIVPAFMAFLSEDSARHVDSEDDLKLMFQNLRGFCSRLATAVLEFAPPGIALQECGD